ncbi:MAG: type II toxin-antitoxin system PemK/MazF family toxin [Oscillospiraceae bacterium]|nr:type II toxin-antitoxin system PemK/MazF family toxin [Oscillospiraceae bacterium]
MAKFIKGDIVVVPFPFSDLSSSKKRPALVLAELKGSDMILCQITSQNVKDDNAVTIELSDIEEGSLNAVSNVRPNKLFTADESIISYKIGSLNAIKMSAITKAVIKMFEK